LGGLVVPLVVRRTARTPARFPRAELLGATAALAGAFALMALREGGSVRLAVLLVFSVAAVVISVVDLREKRVPNPVLLVAGAVVAVLAVLDAALTGAWFALLGAVIGGAALFGAYLLIAFLAPAAMGMGDVKLAALVGFVLGGAGWGAWILGVAAGVLCGGIAATIVLVARRRGPTGSLPYAPTMLLGALIGLSF
jgi:leader peptidase (prepilin peptidase)/N-methyltransferase